LKDSVSGKPAHIQGTKNCYQSDIERIAAATLTKGLLNLAVRVNGIH
jgi:hypothetical protein